MHHLFSTERLSSPPPSKAQPLDICTIENKLAIASRWEQMTALNVARYDLKKKPIASWPKKLNILSQFNLDETKVHKKIISQYGSGDRTLSGHTSCFVAFIYGSEFSAIFYSLWPAMQKDYLATYKLHYVHGHFSEHYIFQHFSLEYTFYSPHVPS